MTKQKKKWKCVQSTFVILKCLGKKCLLLVVLQKWKQDKLTLDYTTAIRRSSVGRALDSLSSGTGQVNFDLGFNLCDDPICAGNGLIGLQPSKAVKSRLWTKECNGNYVNHFSLFFGRKFGQENSSLFSLSWFKPCFNDLGCFLVAFWLPMDK